MQLNKNQLNQMRRDMANNKPTFNTQQKEIDNEALRNLRNQTSKHVNVFEWNIKPGQLVMVKDDTQNVNRLLSRILNTNETIMLTPGEVMTVVDKEVLKYRYSGSNSYSPQQNEFIICFGNNAYVMVHPSILQVIC